jgi:peptide/nickel transport system substrate-binding protein
LAASSAFAAIQILPAMPAFAGAPKDSAATQALVDAGTLPPIAERLPVNPLVVTPVDRPGQQGGVWNHALVGGGSLSMLVRYQAYEPLLRYTPDWSGVMLNVAEAFDPSPDSKVFTIRLRKGMKWSDGEPFTTDDIKFWYEDILLNKEVAFVGQDHWKTNGVPAKLDIVDEQTFTVTFTEPAGFFMLQTAWANSDQTCKAPKHYLQQFHIKYNPDANTLAKSRGYESWIPMFQFEAGFASDNDYFQNSKRPVLTAWKLTVAPGESTERVLAERNPYYFKVDTEGTQLPYFDRIVYQMVADPQVLLLKTLQGEVDMMDQYIATPSNKAVLFDGKEAGKYDFYTLTSTEANEMVFMLNLNHPDKTKNALFNNRDFRVALSNAIDRQALIDTIFIGQGAPAQPSIAKGDPLYVERLATQHTEYDPAGANAALDKLLPNKDGDGYRLDENGKRLTIIFEIDQSRTTFLDMFQLAIPMFQQVGLDVQMQPMDRSLWETRVRQGREFDATAHKFGGNSGIPALLDPRYFLPYTTEAFYGKAWQLWYRDRKNPDGQEPPEVTQKQFELYDELKATADPAGQNKIMLQILELAADAFYTFGVTLPANSYGVVKNDMVNVTKTMPNSFGWPTPGPAMPEQFFKS